MQNPPFMIAYDLVGHCWTPALADKLRSPLRGTRPPWHVNAVDAPYTACKPDRRTIDVLVGLFGSFDSLVALQAWYPSPVEVTEHPGAIRFHSEAYGRKKDVVVESKQGVLATPHTVAAGVKRHVPRENRERSQDLQLKRYWIPARVVLEATETLAGIDDSVKLLPGHTKLGAELSGVVAGWFGRKLQEPPPFGATRISFSRKRDSRAFADRPPSPASLGVSLCPARA
eukprot:scaffold1346_cov260-Pinguiococcus_pyrenoidosus.AAC.1